MDALRTIEEPPFQWSVFSVNLGTRYGSEQSGQRPVLVISREASNLALNTVSVLPITSVKPDSRVSVMEVLLPRGTANLSMDSKVKIHQIVTIDKSRLQRRIGEITEAGLRTRIRATMISYLDLSRDSL